MSEFPVIYAVAGAPATGKTSFVAKGLNEGLFPADALIHDCDALMSSLEGYQFDLKKYGAEEAYARWELPAREQAEAELVLAVESKKDIVYDRSCALLSSYFFLENLVQNEGYQLIMHALYVDAEIAIKRAVDREGKIGRHLPSKVLLTRLEMFSALWPYYLAIADRAYVYDNHTADSALVASSEGSGLVVYDKTAYQNFISQGHACCEQVKRDVAKIP